MSTHDCWVHLRHHGGPTRLLDWTESFYVALYFACCDGGAVDGAVWMLPRIPLLFARPKDGVPTAPEDQWYRGIDKPPEVLVAPVTAHFPRSAAQRGVFTAASSPLVPHEELLAAVLHRWRSLRATPVDWMMEKLIIPHEYKVPFLARLRALGIDPSLLFPGLDGLGASLQESASLEFRGRAAQDADPAFRAWFPAGFEFAKRVVLGEFEVTKDGAPSDGTPPDASS